MTNYSRRAPSQALDTASSRRSRLLCAAALVAASIPAFAATQTALPNRVKGAVDNTSRAALAGTVPPRAMHSTDLGSVSPSMKLQGISLTFSRSAEQQADLATLLTAQQTPGSPQYHQWLTPAQFGARFGISDSDLTAVEDWLQSQGFTDITVSPARERISFSGPEAAVETAFGTSLHYFRATSGSMTAADDEKTHVAPARDITVPAALSGIVLSVGNLSDYRMRPHMIKRPTADFTAAQNAGVYLTPKDVATIYDINPLWSANDFGSGQTIGVIGQSAVVATDISNFQTAAGVPANTPTLSLVPNTGTSAVLTGDEAESDLDLEYTSSIAQKATINFLYTGDSLYYGVFDSLIYGIDYRLANILTVSYGGCEVGIGQSQINAYEAYMQQAAAQGQTVIASSGDSGSTGCYAETTNVATAEALAVNYPASSAFVTGLGGTEFPAADVCFTGNGCQAGNYFTSAGSSDLISSAKSYIPEMVWNDDANSLLAYQKGNISSFSPSSGGGGASIYVTRPTWQTGTFGGAAFPGGTTRLVPDISLDSSADNAGYLYCSSDSGAAGIGFTGSCGNGFHVATGTYTGTSTSATGQLTIAGGTSFAAPIFAAMLAILNQTKGYTNGQGLVNTQLYSLASNTATYSSAFHDITSGNNACGVGATYCGTGAGSTSFSAVTGYDEATGLGSIDLNNLVTAWPTATGGGNTLAATTTTSVTAATLSPATGSPDAITVTVSGVTAAPTGVVTVVDNGNLVTTLTLVPNSALNSSANYSYPASAAGSHTLVFSYGGSSTANASSATAVLNVGNRSFTVSVGNVTVSTAGSASVTVSITPANGYTGTVLLSAATSSSLSNVCVAGVPSLSVTSSAAVSTTFTITTGASTCTGTNNYPLRASLGGSQPSSPWRKAPAPAMLAGLVLMLGLRRRSRLLRRNGVLTLSLAMMFALGFAGMALTGCSNGASGAAAPTPTATGSTTTTAAGSYNLTIDARDSVSFPISASGAGTITVTN